MYLVDKHRKGNETSGIGIHKTWYKSLDQFPSIPPRVMHKLFLILCALKKLTCRNYIRRPPRGLACNFDELHRGLIFSYGWQDTVATVGRGSWVVLELNEVGHGNFRFKVENGMMLEFCSLEKLYLQKTVLPCTARIGGKPNSVMVYK